jgi:hypothetical protein
MGGFVVRLSLFIALLLTSTGWCDKAPPATQRSPLPPFGQLRVLQGDEWSRACDARDLGDTRRAAHEKHFQSGPKYPKNDPKADAEFASVVEAYKDASKSFPATEIDLYCRLRLSGAYQYRGEFDKALDEARGASELFAGTAKAMEADMSVGLIYLQVLHQPREARAWFERVQGAPVLEDKEAQAKWRAAAADALARCEDEIAAEKKAGH